MRKAHLRRIEGETLRCFLLAAADVPLSNQGECVSSDRDSMRLLLDAHVRGRTVEARFSPRMALSGVLAEASLVRSLA